MRTLPQSPRVSPKIGIVARHLHQLAAAQIVKANKEGRHVFYEIDAAAVQERLESILAITRLLQAAIAADTRKTPKVT